MDALITSYTARFKSGNLATLFSNCLPNTLDTTVDTATAQDTFIITGDIPAMWLRDSANQVRPYMRFVTQDQALNSLVQGLIHRHAKSVNIDAVRSPVLCTLATAR